MTKSSEPGPKNGISADVLPDNRIKVNFVENREEVGSYFCEPKDVIPTVQVLLRAATFAHARSGKPPPDRLEDRFAKNPIPVASIGLLPNRKLEQISLSLPFGQAPLVIELGLSASRQLGEALMAASASGPRH